MSSTVAAQSQNKTPPAGTRRTAMLIALIVFIVAGAGLAYAVISFGGPSAVESLLLGTVSGSQGSQPSTSGKIGTPGTAGSPSGTATPSASASGSVSATGQPTVTHGNIPSALPASAQSAMYNGQLKSQDTIAELLGGRISSLSFGRPSKGQSSAAVPTVANYKSGANPSASMKWLRSGRVWFFTGFSPSHPLPSGAADPQVVAIITQQQSSSSSQDAVLALLNGQISSLRILRVSKGAGTATVSCKVGGTGAYAGRACSFSLIKKSSGANTFWFVTRFSWA